MSIYPSVCGGYGVRGDKGDPGEDGTVLNSWRGPWEPGLVYMPGDLVLYEGSVYILNAPPSVPSVYAAMYTPEPPAEPWELFVQGASGPVETSAHWAGFTTELLEAQSGQNYLLNLTTPSAGSDADWYEVDTDRIIIKNPGLYTASGSLSLSLPSAPEPTPALRSFQISLNANPVASETVWAVGRSWATSITSPMVRLDAGSEIRFLVRQDSGLAGNFYATLSLSYAGT